MDGPCVIGEHTGAVHFRTMGNPYQSLIGSQGFRGRLMLLNFHELPHTMSTPYRYRCECQIRFMASTRTNDIVGRRRAIGPRTGLIEA